MRVLHVLNELKPSGAEVMLKLAAPLWSRLDVDCEILSTGASVGAYAETLEQAGYRVHHLPSRRHAGYFFDFSRFVRAGRYSVVHQHAERMSYWFGLAAIFAGARLVRTVHSNFLFEGSLRWRRAIQRKHLRKLGAQFIAIAPGVQTNERTRFGNEATLVWNWIDTDRFRPITQNERVVARKHWGFKNDETVLVSVGNCSLTKNHSAIINALAQISPAERMRYLHVGLEDEASRERNKAIAIGVSSNVTFAGWLANPRTALAAADLFIMPSIYEGLGLAAVEALSTGLPALLARSPGLRDLDSVFSGISYCEPSADGIHQALSAFARSRSKAGEGSSNPTTAFPVQFSAERGTREYARIYESLRGSGRAS